MDTNSFLFNRQKKQIRTGVNGYQKRLKIFPFRLNGQLKILNDWARALNKSTKMLKRLYKKGGS